jgi:EAL domain-containing protein (putative c-di-GMP-specific phosphodiesterase class I)
MREWVLRQACADCMRWPADIKVAVNLSPIQVMNPNLVAVVVGALAAAGLPSSRLEVEITESVLMQNSETTLATLHRLRELGGKISMDDFGTGYSSLSYLRSFPFDKIKIDRCFISGLATGDDSVAIVLATAGLAKHLGIATIAEGVETKQQLQQVKALGCSEMQGFLFSAPLRIGDVTQMQRARIEKDAAAMEVRRLASRSGWTCKRRPLPQFRRDLEQARMLDQGVAVGHAGDEIGHPAQSPWLLVRIRALRPFDRQVRGRRDVAGEKIAYDVFRLIHDALDPRMPVHALAEKAFDGTIGGSHDGRKSDRRPAGEAHVGRAARR